LELKLADMENEKQAESEAEKAEITKQFEEELPDLKNKNKKSEDLVDVRIEKTDDGIVDQWHACIACSILKSGRMCIHCQHPRSPT